MSLLNHWVFHIKWPLFKGAFQKQVENERFWLKRAAIYCAIGSREETQESESFLTWI